jgi:hypothetical protein
MKVKYNIFNMAKCSFTALSILLLFGACEKETRTGIQNSQTVEQQLLNGARKNLQFAMPQNGNRFSAPESFNFAEPSESNTFSNNDGSVTYASNTSGTNYSSSINLTIGGSGSAIIDGKSHNFDFVICADMIEEFTVGEGDEEVTEEFHGTGFFGISGEFNNPNSFEIESMMVFITNQENATGTINLGDFNNFDSENSEEMTNDGFLFFMDFSHFQPQNEDDEFDIDPTVGQDGVKIFFSHDGSASVSPGSLTFSSVKMTEILSDNEEGRMIRGSGTLVCH